MAPVTSMVAAHLRRGADMAQMLELPVLLLSATESSLKPGSPYTFLTPVRLVFTPS